MMRLIKLLWLFLNYLRGYRSWLMTQLEAAVFNPDTFMLRNGMQVVGYI